MGRRIMLNDFITYLMSLPEDVKNSEVGYIELSNVFNCEDLKIEKEDGYVSILG